MDISIFLVYLWGWMFVAFSLMFLLRGKKFYLQFLDIAKDQHFSVLSGYITFFIGLVSILLYNVWSTDWRVVLTIFGWTSLFKGLTLIAFPFNNQKMIGLLKKHVGMGQVFLFVALLIGVWLLWMGYSNEGIPMYY